MIAEMRLVVQLGIGAVFLISASGKLGDPKGFARGVAEYQLLPSRLAYWLGLLLFPLEGLLGVSHLTGWILGLAAPVALGLLTIFGAAVAVNLGRGRVLPCYCFGSRGEEMISRRSLVRILLLLTGEVVVLTDPKLFTGSTFVYPQRIATLEEFGLASIWVSFLLVSGFWLLSLPEFVALLRGCRSCGRRSASAE